MLSFPCIVACARGTWMEKVLPCPGTLSTGRVPLVLNNDALRDANAGIADFEGTFLVINAEAKAPQIHRGRLLERVIQQSYDGLFQLIRLAGDLCRCDVLSGQVRPLAPFGSALAPLVLAEVLSQGHGFRAIVQKHLTRLLICLLSLYPLHLDMFSGRE